MLHIDETNILTNIVFTFNNKNPKNNKWYNRVYLCYENINNKENNNIYTIYGVNCYKYSSLENAHFDSQVIMRNNLDVRYTIIPICKWIPTIFDSLFLHYKLKNNNYY